MRIKPNRSWILIITFLVFFIIYVIGYELFDIQYNDEDIVLTHIQQLEK